ncbi:MAG: Flp pilus assembly protein CpaB [Firmicutes bacterium]|nr:Flp pilus assembly protein CpaB [Bacillota bacterium]
MRRRWVVPAISAVLALLTTGVVVGYLQSLRQQVTVVAPVETAAVVFARTNVGERKLVAPDAVELRQVPVTAIHPQAARRVEDVVNRVAIAPLFADEQVLTSKLAPPGVNVGLSYVLPRDKRAMTIAVNEVVGVAGFVFPGDHVDVVATVSQGDLNLTKIVLQDVEVLAIAQRVEQKPGEEPKVSTSATLAVTPDQAEVLAQVDNNGRVRLALRPHGVADKVQTAGKTIQAALGRAAVAAAPAPQTTGAVRTDGVRRAVRQAAARATMAVAPPAPPLVYAVDVWRSTSRTTVRFEEPRP